jgi:hypothetical protein
MKTTPHRTVVVLAAGTGLIALILLLGWLSLRQPGTPSISENPARASKSVRPDAGTHPSSTEEKNGIIVPDESRVDPVTSVIRRLSAELAHKRNNPSLSQEEQQAAARAILAELRQALRAVGADAASAAILHYLESGTDLATGLGFTLEAGGVLDDAPSLRTALLDLLGQLDPITAVECTTLIFENSRISDEWALALRNLGWQNQTGVHSEMMRARFHEMLHREEWITQPGEGFLQAFDVAVHLGGITEIHEMISLVLPVDSENRPVKTGLTHAAYLALDRLTVKNPQQTLQVLAGDPGLLAWAPEHRASLLARADVSNPEQRALLKSCLATLADRPRELETFTSLFPNRNGSLSHNLITTPPHEDAADPRELDTTALATVRAWIDSGNHRPRDSQLRRIEERLAGFLRPAP